jgi:hypothetical protein
MYSALNCTVCTSQIIYFLLLCMFNFLIVMYVPFSVFCVLFVCKCELYCCHRVSTQFRLNIYNIIYHIIYIIYHIISYQVHRLTTVLTLLNCTVEVPVYSQLNPGHVEINFTTNKNEMRDKSNNGEIKEIHNRKREMQSCVA